MRLRKSYVWLAAGLGLVATGLPAVAGSVEPTISAYNEPGVYGYHSWMPSTATVSPSGSVIFKNPYSGTPHGLKFTGGTAGPPPPSCTGLPAAAETPSGATSWEAKCTFSKAGTYTFVCTVHPEMTGTITVTNGEPTVTTQTANPVSEHEATLKGTVNPNGKATEYFFKWGTTASYGQVTSTKSAGEGTTGVSVSEALKGLQPGTPYHFRLVAKSEKGPAEGADETFTTASPPGPPGATTSSATAVGEAEAALNGTVNPDGKPTKAFFEWGTSTSYGQSTEETPAGEDHLNHPASAKLVKLAPGTVYHFRLVAKNASEEVRGADQMFMTELPKSPASEPSPPIPTTPQPPPSPVPPTTTTRAEPPPGPPIVGGPSLAATQRGSSVRGSLDISPAGAGGRLEVDLLAKGASLAKTRHASSVRVGRLVRTSVSAGNVSFSVALTAAGKRALTRKHRLSLTVKIVVTPTRGTPLSITRSVVLRS